MSPGPPPPPVRIDSDAAEALHRGDRVHVGAFHARPDDPRFSDSGPAQGHLVVFPRTAVGVAHAGRRAFVADPTRVVFYNRGQQYRRTVVEPSGDRCDWFAFAANDVADAIRTHDPTVVERPDAPFTFASAPSDGRAFVTAARAPVLPHPVHTPHSARRDHHTVDTARVEVVGACRCLARERPGRA